MRVLVLAAHMDDETLGVGGTIAKHAAAGDDVHIFIASDRAYNHVFDSHANHRERECSRMAAKILGARKPVFGGLHKDETMDERLIDLIVPFEKAVEDVKPEVVYINHRGDANQDHRAAFQAAVIACRVWAGHRVSRVLCYEVPSSTEFAPPFPEYAFQPNVFVDISKHLDRKIEALQAYGRELRDFPHPRSRGGVEALARKRGTEAGFLAAEAFILVRDSWG
ncbi:PIG-L family deacetylase [bacterium]|nr:MAG: PIG-L family deacetylase [bacterium]